MSDADYEKSHLKYENCYILWKEAERGDHLHCFFVILNIICDHIFTSHHAGNVLQMSST